MRGIALFLLFAVGAFVYCEAVRLRASSVRLGANPGFLIRIRKNALDSFFKNSALLAAKYGHKIPVPDVSVTISGVDIDTKNVRVTQFDEPTIDYALNAPDGVSGHINFTRIQLEGGYNATRRVFVTSQKDNGTVGFTVTGAYIKFRTQIGSSPNGIPIITQFDCIAILGQGNLQVKSRVKERFAIEVLSKLARGFRPAYETQACAVAKRVVSKQLNGFLGQLPNVLNVNKDLALKFQVTPIVGQDFVETRFFGKVITSLVSPHAPAPFVEAENSGSHVVIFLSDALLNDVLYQGYNNQKLQFKIHKDSHPLLYNTIRLQCNAEQSACLGNKAPSLRNKYGADAAVEVIFKASQSPEVEFSQGKATFKAALDTSISVTPANGTETYHEATIGADIKGSLQVKIKNKVALAKVALEGIEVHVDGDHQSDWANSIKETIKRVVEDYINGDALLKGIPLRLPFGFGLDEPNVTFQPGTLQVQTSFEYQAVTSSEQKDGSKETNYYEGLQQINGIYQQVPPQQSAQVQQAPK